jgi:hypothetical protein
MKIDVNEKGTMILTNIYNPIVLESETKENFIICNKNGGFEFEYNGVLYFAKCGKLTPYLKRATEPKVEEPHEPPKEEVNESQFNIGDVVIVNDSKFIVPINNFKGTVVEYNSKKDEYLIRFDEEYIIDFGSVMDKLKIGVVSTYFNNDCWFKPITLKPYIKKEDKDYKQDKKSYNDILFDEFSNLSQVTLRELFKRFK